MSGAVDDRGIYCWVAPKHPSKSNARRVFGKAFPGAFVDADRPAGTFDVAIEDTLQSMQRVGTGDLDPALTDGSFRLDSGAQLAREMAKSAVDLLERTHCRVYVFCFDKSRHVPLAKAVEQCRRNEEARFVDDSSVAPDPFPTKKRTKPAEAEAAEAAAEEGGGKKKRQKRSARPRNTVPADGISFRDRRPYLLPDRPIPPDWQEAMSDRDDTRQQIIRDLCTMWLFDDADGVRLCPPEGKSIVIDGHCMSGAALRSAGVLDADDNQGDEHVYDVPICIGAMPFADESGTSEEGRSLVRLMPESLGNDIGETDMQVFYLHRRLCELACRTLSCALFTTDTDTMLLAPIYALHYPKFAENVYWRYQPSPSWVFRDTDRTFRKEEGWVCIGDLVRAMQASAPAGTSKTVAVLSLVAVAAIGGGDYTTGYYNLTYERLFEAYRKHRAYIGELIVEKGRSPFDFRINGRAYARLIKTAFVLSRSGPKGRLRDLSPERCTAEEVARAVHDLAEQNRFPHPKTVATRALHLLHYLRMASFAGCQTVREPDPLRYGYGPIDPTRAVGRDNIDRYLSARDDDDDDADDIISSADVDDLF